MSVVPPPSQPPAYQESQLLGQQPASPPTPQSPPSSTPSASSIGATIITIQQPSSDGDSPEVKVMKQAILNHPLFPLMASLFEKCEAVTHSPDVQASESCDEEIRTFLHLQEKQQKPFLSGDAELDELMVKAIQVLRIHLLELEKVNDLCKDFCSRYISCLKSKLHNENLLRIDSLSDDSPPPPNPSHISPTVQTATPMAMQQMMSQGGVVTSLPGGGMVYQPPVPPPPSLPGVSMATISQGQIISGNTVYQMVQTPQGIVAQPIQVAAPAPAPTELSQAVPQQLSIHGTTPLSQIGVISPVTSQVQQASSAVASSAALSDSVFDDDDSGKKKSKRGVLPKHATQVMKSWLFQHIVHPYPNEEEKRVIAAETKLSLLQVNNWFINARRRILQPMLDATNPSQSGASKAKKSKPSSRPLQRFWPDSIANLRPRPPLQQQQEAGGGGGGSDLENQGEGAEEEHEEEEEEDDDDDEDLEDENSSQDEAAVVASVCHNQNVMPVFTYVMADGQLVTPGSVSLVGSLQASMAPLLQVRAAAHPGNPSPPSSTSDNSQSQPAPEAAGTGNSETSD